MMHFVKLKNFGKDKSLTYLVVLQLFSYEGVKKSLPFLLVSGKVFSFLFLFVANCCLSILLPLLNNLWIGKVNYMKQISFINSILTILSTLKNMKICLGCLEN